MIISHSTRYIKVTYQYKLFLGMEDIMEEVIEVNNEYSDEELNMLIKEYLLQNKGCNTLSVDFNYEDVNIHKII